MNIDLSPSFVLNFFVGAMVISLLIPLYQAWKFNNDIWEIMLAFSSIAAKSAVMILVIAVLRDDWMLGVVGVIILSVGNAGFMLLAHIIRRIGEYKND
jgi:multicomponent Na+:H+ antiporter subunit F